MIQECNKTIKTIGNFFCALQNKLLIINEKVSYHIKIEHFRNILNQLNILYDTLQLMRDI